MINIINNQRENTPRRHILLLTATIQPRKQAGLKIFDMTQRLHEYEQALEMYVNHLSNGHINGIIFAENSGFPLNSLITRFPDPRIEWLSWPDGLDYDPTFHRGYGEFVLIEYVSRHSQLWLTAAKREHSATIWKITGRYQLMNLRRVLQRAPAFDVYCDVRGHWAEMSVMAWSPMGYERVLRSIWPRFATGMAPELILAKALEAPSSKDGPKLVNKMRWPTLLEGRRGTDGSSYRGKYWLPKHLLGIAKCLSVN
jgi:hypothetical protein